MFQSEIPLSSYSPGKKFQTIIEYYLNEANNLGGGVLLPPNDLLDDKKLTPNIKVVMPKGAYGTTLTEDTEVLLTNPLLLDI